MKKKHKAILVTLMTFVSVVISFRLITGYYPLSDLFCKLYYINQNEEKKLDAIVIEPDFKFYQEDYFVSQKVNSPYPLPHFLIISFVSENIPLGFETELSLKLNIFRKGKLIYSVITDDAKPLYERDTTGKLLGINGFSLTEIPYPLRRKGYEEIWLEITVLHAEETLQKYIDQASLLLFPDLTL